MFELKLTYGPQMVAPSTTSGDLLTRLLREGNNIVAFHVDDDNIRVLKEGKYGAIMEGMGSGIWEQVMAFDASKYSFIVPAKSSYIPAMVDEVTTMQT